MKLHFFKKLYFPLHKKIISLAVPSFIALIAEPLLGIVDTALIGHLGVKELGALAIITAFLSGMMWLFNFFVSGTTANISFYYGKNDVATANRFFMQSQLLALGVGLLLIIFGILMEPLVFKIMGATEDIQTLGHSYYLIRLFGIPFVFSYFVSMGYLRGFHDMKTPMLITISINIINAVGDYILIYGFSEYFDGFGLKGAAIATLSSQIVACFWYMHTISKKHNINIKQIVKIKIESTIFTQIIRVNKHLFFRTFFLLVSFTFATAMASRMNEMALGAHQIGLQIWLFCSFAIDSFAIAGQSIAGQLKGKGSFNLLHLYGRFLQVWGIILGIVFSMLFIMLDKYIILIFTSEPELVETVQLILPLIILFQPFNGITFILDGILIGVSDTRFLMVQLFIASILCYIPIAYLSLLFNWGIMGVWIGLGVFLIVRLLMNEYRFLSKRYMTV